MGRDLKKEDQEFQRELTKSRRSTGLSFIILGILFIGILVFPLVVGFDSTQVIGMILAVLLFGGIGVIMIIAGIRTLKSNPLSRVKDE